MPLNNPSTKILKRLRPLAEFEPNLLSALSHQLNIQTANRNETLLTVGDIEQSSLFILSGDILVTSRDGKKTDMQFDHDDPINPIAQLRPSMYDIVALKNVTYLKISKSLLIQFANLSEGEDDNNGVVVSESTSSLDTITFQIYQDMQADKISLPSLPEIALKIQKIYQDDLADINSISEIIILDPSISAKLIKIANSVVYQGEVPTETLKSAISRLGLTTTYNQVMAYVVNELFKSQSENLKQAMSELWFHSRKVAAISHLLAQKTKTVNPDSALLAGLVHDLGNIVILQYLENNKFIKTDVIDVEQTLNIMRPQITSMLMKNWNFSAETITVAEECEDWFRNPDGQADLCDIILIAQYHSYIGSDKIKELPPIQTIPAMKKLGLTPQTSIELIKQSKDQVHAMESILK